MSIAAGTYRFGPGNATLSVHTERAGAAAMAGHDLVIRVTSWEGELVVGEDPAATTLQLTADPTSLRVIAGTGGMQPLDDEGAASIQQTIDEEILVRKEIGFHSTRVEIDEDRIHAEGDLTLVGETRPIGVDLVIDDAGEVSGSAAVKQSAWGMKPYSALFGTLKVKDEVLVVLEGHL